jgi:hypothetical protein
MTTQTEALKRIAYELHHYNPSADTHNGANIHKLWAKEIKEALAQPENEPEQNHEHRCCPHDSDCAVHNMPAYPAGPCDCTYKNTHNLPPSDVVHEICLALTKRVLDKIEHENFGRMPNDSWTNKVLDVYHFFDSNPKAKKLTVIYTTTPQPQSEARGFSQSKPLTDEQKYALIEKHLGLKQRRDNTVIDQYTGLFYSAQPYFDLINEAAHGIKE